MTHNVADLAHIAFVLVAYDWYVSYAETACFCCLRAERDDRIWQVPRTLGPDESPQTKRNVRDGPLIM